MGAAVERLGFRVSVNVKRHLEDAARLLGVPLTEFVLGAARRGTGRIRSSPRRRVDRTDLIENEELPGASGAETPGRSPRSC